MEGLSPDQCFFFLLLFLLLDKIPVFFRNRVLLNDGGDALFPTNTRIPGTSIRDVFLSCKKITRLQSICLSLQYITQSVLGKFFLLIPQVSLLYSLFENTNGLFALEIYTYYRFSWVNFIKFHTILIIYYTFKILKKKMKSTMGEKSIHIILRFR